jgi:chloramphenicol-sensitive protein RarD
MQIIGIWQAVAAYLIWGGLPFYIKSIANVSSFEILAHIMIWSFVFLLTIISSKRHFSWLKSIFSNKKTVICFVASAFLMCANWIVYIWAVNIGRVVDASLGYFISPLINVIFGYLILNEKIYKSQWIAIFIAAFGVLWLTFQAGQLPYIGLFLAASFGLYGLLRKTSDLGALEGLFVEMLIIAPFALGYFLFLSINNNSSFFIEGTSTKILLIAAGPIASIPLLLFASGARKISMSLLGMLQYIEPSLQMALGVFLWNEEVSFYKFIGFILIWIALLFYAIATTNKK